MSSVLALEFPYTFRRQRQGRQGWACRVVKRTPARLCIEFRDGNRMVVSPVDVVRQKNVMQGGREELPEQPAQTTAPALTQVPAAPNAAEVTKAAESARLESRQ